MLVCCLAMEAHAAVPDAFLGSAASEPIIGLPGNEVGDIVYSGTSLWLASAGYVCRLVGSGEHAADWESYDFGSVLAGEGPTALCAHGDTIWVATGYTTTYHGEQIPAGNGLYLSTDGGEAWEHFETEDLFPDRLGTTYPDNYTTCYDIVYDGANLWASYTAGFLLRTANAGDTWEQILPDSGEFDFQNPRHHGQCVLAYDDTLWVGTFGGVLHSVDGGSSWVCYDVGVEGLSGNFVPALGRQVVDGASIVWASAKPFNPGEVEGVSLTRDQGKTWEHINIRARTIHPQLEDTSAVSAWNFAFGSDVAGSDVTDSTVWVATDEALFRSDDLGATWRKLEIRDQTTGAAADRDILYVAFIEQVLWVSTPKGLAKSSDYGQTWRILASPLRTQSLDGGTFVPGLGQAGEDIRTYAYQNPFSPSRHGTTKIQYSLSEPARVTIKVYDFAGVLVAELARDELREGGLNHSQEWDGLNDGGRQVANGTYFYRIETDEGHRAFGKIVVLD